MNGIPGFRNRFRIVINGDRMAAYSRSAPADADPIATAALEASAYGRLSWCVYVATRPAGSPTGVIACIYVDRRTVALRLLCAIAKELTR